MDKGLKKAFDDAKYAEFNIEDKTLNLDKDLHNIEERIYNYLMEMLDEYTECIKAYPNKTKEYLAEMITEFMELLDYIN